MDQRLSLVTLGVSDLARARAFYEALGWRTGAGPDDDVVFFDTGGLIAAPLDYTKVGQPSERAIYIAKPADVIGGLRPLPGTFESATAKSYEIGGS